MIRLIISIITNSKLPLTWQLRLLRVASAIAWRQSAIQGWAETHPKIAIGSKWCSRAWWGVNAGKVLRYHLEDPNLRSAALELLDPTDWSEFDKARASGGVIVATAHLGPPKFLMHIMLERRMPLLVWTNTADLPEWLSHSPNATFLDPLPPAERAVLLVKSAMHLRQGEVLLGAADMNTGGRSQELNRFDYCWHLSPGLPALARRLAVPTFIMLALWQGNRIKIMCQRIEISEKDLTDEQWRQAWLDRYWSELEKIISSSPENLRFLRKIDKGRYRQELGL